MADGAIVPLGEPKMLGCDLLDETILVDVSETAHTCAGGVNERIVIFVSLLQANPALPFAFDFWIVQHNINSGDSSNK